MLIRTKRGVFGRRQDWREELYRVEDCKLIAELNPREIDWVMQYTFDDSVKLWEPLVFGVRVWEQI